MSAALAFASIPDRDSAADLRRALTAVYGRRASALRELARPRVRHAAEAWDAVQDAVLFVLEHPPSDCGEAALAAALDAAVRLVCAEYAKRHAGDERLRIALRKRFPV
jgi:hypothetical protein